MPLSIAFFFFIAIMRKTLFFLSLFCLIAFNVAAGGRPTSLALSGLSVFVDAGLLVPNGKQASFYSGRPDCPNTINRVLHSQAYGNEIWSLLKGQGYMQGIGSYNEIEIAEYPSMYYKLTYQIGLGIRYDYSGGWGWQLRFDYSQLSATGIVQLLNGPQAGVLTNQSRYVSCGMLGTENRIYIDLALTKRFRLSSSFELETDLGFNFNNTKVKSQDMTVCGRNFNLLDIWGSANELYSGVGSYEYINQGGLGIGGFGSVALSFVMPGTGSLDIGYSLYYTQTVYTDYNKSDAFALQHVIFAKFNLNGFSFFNAE